MFTCGATSRKARDLARDPRLVVQLESRAEVVIVEGEADQIAPTSAILAEYVEKYGPVEAEIGNWYGVRPRRILAWREDTTRGARRRSPFSYGRCQAQSPNCTTS